MNCSAELSSKSNNKKAVLIPHTLFTSATCQCIKPRKWESFVNISLCMFVAHTNSAYVLIYMQHFLSYCIVHLLISVHQTTDVHQTIQLCMNVIWSQWIITELTCRSCVYTRPTLILLMIIISHHPSSCFSLDTWIFSLFIIFYCTCSHLDAVCACEKWTALAASF